MQVDFVSIVYLMIHKVYKWFYVLNSNQHKQFKILSYFLCKFANNMQTMIYHYL